MNTSSTVSRETLKCAPSLTWICEASRWGSFATKEQAQIFEAEFESTRTIWRAAIRPDEKGMWQAQLTRKRFCNLRAKALYKMSGFNTGFDGNWSFGPFQVMEEAQKAIELYLAIRSSPLTWRQDAPLISHESYGHFSQEEINALSVNSGYGGTS